MTADPAVAEGTSRGLHHLPVVALTESVLLDVVRAGVRRAGGDPSILVIRAAANASLRSVMADAHEAVIALCGVTSVVEVIRAVRELGGRPILVLSISDGERGPVLSPASLRLLTVPGLQELEIPVPAADDDVTRKFLWDQLRDARAEERHHLVEVDGRPALEELGTALPADGWACAAAGAAGVLAGRLVSSNRRWRAQLDA